MRGKAPYLAQGSLHALKVLLLVEVGGDELGNEGLDDVCQCEQEEAHQGLQQQQQTAWYRLL